MLKGDETFIYVEEDLVGQTAGDPALAELALRIDIAVELVGIARKVGVIANRDRIVSDPVWPRSWNDRLQPSNLAILEGIRGLAEVVGKTAGERQFIERMNPVRTEVVEFPIRVSIHLLQCV